MNGRSVQGPGNQVRQSEDGWILLGIRGISTLPIEQSWFPGKAVAAGNEKQPGEDFRRA
jgi:hypothetical protein